MYNMSKELLFAYLDLEIVLSFAFVKISKNQNE